MKGKLIFTTAAAAATAVLSSPTAATTIEYSFTGIATGSLGGVPFHDRPILIRQTSDTAHIEDHGDIGMFIVRGLTTTLSIEGMPSATFLTPTRVYGSQWDTAAGLARWGPIDPDMQLINLHGPFDNYDLSTEIGPVLDAQPIPMSSFGTVVTTRGILRITDLPDGIEFRANVEQVPAPAAALYGIVLLACGRRRNF